MEFTVNSQVREATGCSSSADTHGSDATENAVYDRARYDTDSRETTQTAARSRTAEAIRNLAGGNVAEAPIVKMLIGGKEYLVHIKKIPYLQSLVDFQQRSGQLVEGQMPVHEDNIPFFETINFAVSHGFRQFLRFIPPDLDQYRVLSKTLDYLLIDILQKREMHDIAKDVENAVTAWITHTRNGNFQEVKRLPDEAGDTAFRLLYMIITGKVEGEFRSGYIWDEEDWRNPAFRPTRTIMINMRLWDQQTKRMLLRAYQERFGVSCELQMCYDFCIEQWTKLMK